MHEIDAANAAAYLTVSGLIAADEPVTIRVLDGGVSNMVLLVERAGGAGSGFVVKQARHQLRTRQPWFSRLERIWREIEVIEVCQTLLDEQKTAQKRGQNYLLNSSDPFYSVPRIDIPRILFVDRENYLFAMTAAQAAEVWKSQLLAGRADDSIAQACGHLLATLHGLSWRDPALAAALGDRSLFDELRIDPYYRTLIAAHPELRPELERLIDSVAQHRLSLVHADFSPKNLLVGPAGLMMVDFETGHFGEPAFDLGFFQSHLVLKAFYHAPRHEPMLRLADVFWRRYRAHLAERVETIELVDLERRSILNFAGCALARLDGKSPVDYLADPLRSAAVRHLCVSLLRTPPLDWQSTLSQCRAAIAPLATTAADPA